MHKGATVVTHSRGQSDVRVRAMGPRSVTLITGRPSHVQGHDVVRAVQPHDVHADRRAGDLGIVVSEERQHDIDLHKQPKDTSTGLKQQARSLLTPKERIRSMTDAIDPCTARQYPRRATGQRTRASSSSSSTDRGDLTPCSASASSTAPPVSRALVLFRLPKSTGTGTGASVVHVVAGTGSHEAMSWSTEVNAASASIHEVGL